MLALKPLLRTPKLEELPVYVREGAIVPMQPLVQSTEETPKGPLRLRVYPATSAGVECRGEVYADDGKSFAFRKGTFLRESFSCATGANGTVTVEISKREGSYKPWWSAVQVEVVGWTPVKGQARTTTGAAKVQKDEDGTWSAMIPDTGGGGRVAFE